MNELFLQDYILKQISRRYTLNQNILLVKKWIKPSYTLSDKIEIHFGKLTKDFFPIQTPDPDNLFHILIQKGILTPDHTINECVLKLKSSKELKLPTKYKTHANYILESLQSLFLNETILVKVFLNAKDGLKNLSRNDILTILNVFLIRSQTSPIKKDVAGIILEYQYGKRFSELNKYYKANKNIQKAIYELTYSMSNKILLNKKTVISQPQFDSENDIVFGYLIKHPNTAFTRQQIAKATERTIGKSFHKIVENLGFTEEIRRLFFKVSDSSILLRNPIYSEMIDELEIDTSKIPNYLSLI